MSKVFNVLILCTGNSARSIMGEGLFNVLGAGRIKAYSAGSKPTGKPNPFAVEKMGELGYDTANIRSKSWDEYAAPDAPQMDFVITVCDNAAGETCPYWPGAPLRAHWGFEDPADAQGSDEDKRAAFAKIYAQIKKKVQAILDLNIEQMTQQELQLALNKIGSQAV